MPKYSSDTNRIAKNTIALYFRMLLSIIISLYTSRIILEVLGVNDYGIYSVVGGVIGMISFINSSMGAASARYLSYELGQPNNGHILDVFNSAVIIHIIIAIIFILLSETVGLWYLKYQLVIPDNSKDAAMWVYQTSIAVAAIGILQTPYNAIIIAKEHMSVYAYVEILNVCLKLGIVYLLIIIPYNKLILYGILYLMTSIIIAGIYRLYCIRNFKEVRFKIPKDKSFIRPMMSFSGWNLIGDIGYSVRQNGSNLVLNHFFGTIVNAANGIAMVIQGTIMGLSLNVITALRPPIIKEYSVGNNDKVSHMLSFGAILAFTLMSLLSGPIIINIDAILKLWLKIVPRYTSDFTIVCLFSGCIACASNVLYIGLQATNQIRQINLIRFILYSTSLIFLYYLLQYGYPPITAYIIIFIILSITMCFNCFQLKHFFPAFQPVMVSISLILSLILMISGIYIARMLSPTDNGFIELVVSSSIYIIYVCMLSFFLVFRKRDRKFILSMITSIKRKIYHG